MIVENLPTAIRRYPDPCLRAKCEPVKTFDDSLASLAQRMLEIMRAGQGVGLAGPQVGVCRRLFVCNPTGESDDDRIYVNPELFDLTGVLEGEEGCLSLPEVRVNVRRAKRCWIKAFDVTGRPIEEEGQELIARIWQHETEHLDGRLILDRMTATDQIANKKLITQLEDDYHDRARK